MEFIVQNMVIDNLPDNKAQIVKISATGDCTIGWDDRYSLPRDMDAFIYQQTFNYLNGELQLNDNINIIPVYISSVKNVNNYQPTILEGNDRLKALEKIMKYSSGFSYK